MNKSNERKIREAIAAVYRDTDSTGFKIAEVRFMYVKPEYLGFVNEREITISRSIKQDDLTYKLYTKHDKNPLITVFGCWPKEFVSDIFIRALEHFYDDYSDKWIDFGVDESKNGWVRF